MMYNYFKKLFKGIFFQLKMIFQNSLMLWNPGSFVLAGMHTLHTYVEQVQIIWRRLFLKKLANANTLGQTLLIAKM